MKKFKVFDINKPLFDAETEVLAENGIDAIKKVLGDSTLNIRLVKHGGRFSVDSGRQKRTYDIFK